MVFDILCKLSPKDIICMKWEKPFPKETICMKCQNLFSRKKKKTIFIVSSAKCADKMVKENKSGHAKIGLLCIYKQKCLEPSAFGIILLYVYSFSVAQWFSKRTARALIRLRRWACWSAPVRSTYV